MKLSGGRAFPKSDTIANGEVLYRDEGMTLRQWYAGQVLPAIFAYIRADIVYSELAKEAFRIADAMIEEGNK